MLKSKWTKLALGVVAVVGIGAGAGLAAAPAGHKDLGDMRAWADRPLGRLITGRIGRAMTLRSELNLSAEQREQVGTIVKAHREEIAAALKPVVEQRRALRDAVSAAKPDEKAIRAAASDLGKSIGAAAIVGARVRGEVAKVLTAEQMEKVQRFHAENDGAVDGLFKELGAQP